MQGDRVSAEYYLQFADHYFRVLNEHRARQEEFRERQRQHEPRYDDAEDGDDRELDESASGFEDEDPTAPIAISGLPPAISGARGERDPQAATAAGEGEGDDDIAPDQRGRRGRPPANGAGAGNGERARPPRFHRSDSHAAVEAEQPQADEGQRPARGRRPSAKDMEASPRLELTVGAPQDDDAEEAVKPRRRTRRLKQDSTESAA